MTDNFYASLPRKRIGAGALFLDAQGHLLIVQPTYRPDWLLPGGSVELDESPARACEREVLEELGLHVPLIRLLCVDYTASDAEKNEAIQFIFYGGVLSAEQIRTIKLPEAELSSYRLVTPAEAQRLLNPKLAKRIPYCVQALQQQTAFYLDDGQPLA